MKKKLVLAYSGGLDTSVILHWLAAQGYDVTCFVANVGQKEDFDAVEKKALATGASAVFIEDLQREFVEEYVFKALQAGAVYENIYLLGTALARPLIAKKQVELAQTLEALYLAHGATGKGNDQVRFELSYMSLMPDVQIISPWKNQEFLSQFQGRSDLIAYALKHTIPLESATAKPYSIDENIAHTSYEGGMLEDPWHYEEVYKKTVSPYLAPDTPINVTISFKQGVPVTVRNETTKEVLSGSLELFEYLNALGSAHAIGRINLVENRVVGIKSRGFYEAPAATILMAAHRDLESITLDREVAHAKAHMSLSIAKLIYNGLWESPEMAFLMAAINHSQCTVTGTVHLEIYKGSVIVKARASEHSLYQAGLASMEVHGGYSQADAAGFIAIQGLRLKTSKALNMKGKKHE